MSFLLPYTKEDAAYNEVVSFVLDKNRRIPNRKKHVRSPELLDLFIDLPTGSFAGGDIIVIKTRPIGSTVFRTYATVDLTTLDLDYEIRAVGIDEIRLEPAIVDVAATFSVFALQKGE